MSSSPALTLTSSFPSAPTSSNSSVFLRYMDSNPLSDAPKIKLPSRRKTFCSALNCVRVSAYLQVFLDIVQFCHPFLALFGFHVVNFKKLDEIVVYGMSWIIPTLSSGISCALVLQRPLRRNMYITYMFTSLLAAAAALWEQLKVEKLLSHPVWDQYSITALVFISASTVLRVFCSIIPMQGSLK